MVMVIPLIVLYGKASHKCSIPKHNMIGAILGFDVALRVHESKKMKVMATILGRIC
jgi:hypothetical protein